MNADIHKTYIGDSDQYLLCFINTDAGNIPDPRYKGTKEEIINYLVSEWCSEGYGYDIDIAKCRRYYTSKFQHVVDCYKYWISYYDNNADSDDDERNNDYTGWIIYRL